MKNISIQIEGTTPLLLHRFTDQAQLDATSGTRSSINTDELTPSDLAEQGLYLNDDGISGIPGPNLLRCLIDGGIFHKIGRSKVSTQKSSLVPAAMQINEMFIPIESKAGWKVDTRPVRIPATGGRILRHRPSYDDWKLTFSLELDDEIIGSKLCRELVDTAGKRIGLGDFRPACKGPYGRFVVISWKPDNGK